MKVTMEKSKNWRIKRSKNWLELDSLLVFWIFWAASISSQAPRVGRNISRTLGS